ncbi:hypothetical protein [[Clostridium] symbiosum]|uniref:hypothetical protein n=1 Tax=Clostridium symbiosum TaxID=1512 RepID=UPI001FAC1506|nr:hypothetical protein [[Clostridium] symbiosum]
MITWYEEKGGKQMEISGLQIIFILIVSAEWIFMGSTKVFRGYMAERWEMPVGLKSAGYAAALVFCLPITSENA